MINEIVTNTNNSILDFRERFRDTLVGIGKYSYCAITDSIEMKAFFGFQNITTGIQFDNKETLPEAN